MVPDGKARGYCWRVFQGLHMAMGQQLVERAPGIEPGLSTTAGGLEDRADTHAIG